MSGVDHTCAAISCAFGKVYGRFLRLVSLSSPREPLLSLSTGSSLSTCATHCFSDMLRIGNVSWRQCSTAIPFLGFPKSFDKSCQHWFVVQRQYCNKCAVCHTRLSWLAVGASTAGWGVFSRSRAVVSSHSSRSTTGWFREVETTVFDPASVFLSTHWWSQKPSLPVLFL